MHDVRCNPGHDGHDREDDEVAGLCSCAGPGNNDAEQLPLWYFNRRRYVVIVEPRDPDKTPLKKELGCQCRDREIKALDA